MKNLLIRGSVLVGLCLCAQFLAITSTATAQPFTTVINIPSDPAPANIGSDTQLNLFEGGSLPNGFALAGTLHGLNSNIEVNVEGGTTGNNVLLGVPEGFGTNSDIVLNINSGTVGTGLTVNAGGVVNINGGTVGDFLEVVAGGTVNLNAGGVLGDRVTPFNGSTFNINGGSIGEFFEPRNNTAVNISGGTIGEGFSLGFDTRVSISGGVVPSIQYVGVGGVLNLSGGNIDSFFANDTDTTISGSEFMLDGAPIPGLETPGSSVTIPTSSGFLTTTFADGAVFASSPSALGDTLTLHAIAAPAKPSVINSPTDPETLGLREGQTLNLSAGAELVKFFRAIDSTLNIGGGNVGRGLKAYGSTVDITDGALGEYFSATSGSTVNISGGQLAHGMVLSESYARITGGDIAGLDAASNSIVDVFGGSIDDIDARSGSIVNLTGLSFILDGVNLTPGLTPGDQLVITARDVVIEGLLADGSPFSFDLDNSSSSVSNNFDTTATLTVTLVPEPGAVVVVGVGGLTMLWRRRGAL